MPDWRDEIVTALDYWIALDGGTAGAPSWAPLGRIRPDAERGWYALDVRGRQLDADQLDAPRVAGKDMRAEDGYPVLDVVQQGQLIRVRVPEFVDLREAYLWHRKKPKTYLTVKLRDGIAAMGDAGLGHDLAAGRLTIAPRVASGPAGFAPEQREAYASCFQPGVRLVWGPPGTGKTRVLAEAIDALAQAGKRVLLVSSTNIAVDNALLSVVKQRRHVAGTLLRVGPAHLPEIAANTEVSMAHLVKRQLAATEAELAAIEDQLVEISRAELNLATAETMLAGFDPARYARIRDRVVAADQIPGLALAASDAQARQDEHARHAAEAERAQRVADQNWRDAEQTSAIYADIDQLAAELDRVNAATDELGVRALLARQQLDTLEQELSRLGAAGLGQRLANGSRRKNVRAEIANLAPRVEELDQKAREARELAQRREQVTRRRTAELLTAASFDRVTIDSRAVALAEAKQAAVETAAVLTDTTRRLEAARAALLAAEASAPPTADRQYLADADRRGLPDLYRQRQQLHSQVSTNQPRRQQLEKSYAQIHDRLDRLRQDTEATIINQAQVVATTLARFRTIKALIEGTFDVVLVDEVAAATIPEVILAVSRAKRTAVLLGDFLQLGAVLANAKLERTERPDVVRWLRRDVFELCNITTAAQAQAHRGCTTLRIQHRFGRDVMDLANAVAYDGALEPGTKAKVSRQHDDPEIVLVDIDDLGDLARVRPTSRTSGWWPAGALLARVLADYHVARGEIVGIVTPYRDQVQATLEAVRDREGDGTVETEVGTAHRFQGREFPIVVFDLVEDQYDSRWIAQASRTSGSFQRSGLRLFTVAITRTQTRIYLIASRKRIDQALPGTPLAAIATMFKEGRIRTVPASWLITPPTVPSDQRPQLGVFSSELVDILAQHVRVTDIADERAFYDGFTDQIRQAGRSIWIWAAWTARRVRTLIPILSDAHARGVTIRVFVRDDRDNLQKRQDFQQYLSDLRAVVSSVVAIHEMHQKIVVIDEQTTLLGSLNVLSQSSTREVMLTMQGHHFARKLLEHEHAAEFANPPACGRCHGTEIDLRRRANNTWYWRCSARHCMAQHGNRAWTIDALPDAGRMRIR